MTRWDNVFESVSRVSAKVLGCWKSGFGLLRVLNTLWFDRCFRRCQHRVHFYNFESLKSIFGSVEGIPPGCSWGVGVYQGCSTRFFWIIGGFEHTTIFEALFLECQHVISFILAKELALILLFFLLYFNDSTRGVNVLGFNLPLVAIKIQ